MAENKKEKHRCPEIDKAVWNVKVTGPAYVRGMSEVEARAAWSAYLRVLNASVRPMPRKNY